MTQYPEHQKMHEAQKEAIILGEFLENLGNMGLILCDKDGDGFGRLLGTRRSTEQILAQHLCIDLKKIEAEKQEMLDTIRRNNAEDRELGR